MGVVISPLDDNQFSFFDGFLQNMGCPYKAQVVLSTENDGRHLDFTQPLGNRLPFTKRSWNVYVATHGGIDRFLPGNFPLFGLFLKSLNTDRVVGGIIGKGGFKSLRPGQFIQLGP